MLCRVAGCAVFVKGGFPGDGCPRASGEGRVTGRMGTLGGMIDAVVFDFDGVIVDSEPVHFEAFAAVLAEMGITLTLEEYMSRYIGFDDRDCFREVLFARTGVKPPAESDQVRDLIERKKVAFEEAAGKVKPMPGAVELVEALSAEMPLAIASGAGRFDIDLICRGLGIADRFVTIVSADDVAKSKPDPTAYRLAVQRLGELCDRRNLTPGRCLAIVDTTVGLLSAGGAGLMTLAVATTLPADRVTLGVRVVDSLAGVGVAELREWFKGGGEDC